MASELKLCPFCHKTSHLKIDPFYEPSFDGYYGFNVVCSAAGFDNTDRGCGAAGAWGETEEDAATRWNTRPAPVATDAGLVTVAWQHQDYDEWHETRVPEYHKNRGKNVRELVTRSQAEAIIAAKDREIERLTKSLIIEEQLNAAQAARIKELEEATSNQKEMYHKQIDFAGELQRLLWALKEGNELPDGAKDSHAYTVASLIKDRFSKLEKKCVRLHSENKKMRMSKYYDRLGRCEARVSELVEQLVNSEQKKEALEAKLAAAHEALEPFAAVLEDYDPDWEDDDVTAVLVVGSVTHYGITLGDFRQARAVLGGKPS